MSGVKICRFPVFIDTNGQLGVYEFEKSIPFLIRRTFVVSARKGDVRGEHAHRKCTQLLVCPLGKVVVTYNGGDANHEFVLEGMETGLLIPPGVWAKQEYLASPSLLMVFCDQGYDDKDYIRDFDEFKRFVNSRGEK